MAAPCRVLRRVLVKAAGHGGCPPRKHAGWMARTRPGGRWSNALTVGAVPMPRGLHRHLRAINRYRVLVFSILGFTVPGMRRWNRLQSAIPTVHTRCRESKYQKSYDHFLGPSESARIRLTCESWHEFEKKFGRSNRSGRGGAYHGAHRTSGGGAPGLAGLGRLGGARVRAKVPVTLLAQGSRGHESELKIFKRNFFRFSTKNPWEIAQNHHPG